MSRSLKRQQRRCAAGRAYADAIKIDIGAEHRRRGEPVAWRQRDAGQKILAAARKSGHGVISKNVLKMKEDEYSAAGGRLNALRLATQRLGAARSRCRVRGRLRENCALRAAPLRKRRRSGCDKRRQAASGARWHRDYGRQRQLSPSPRSAKRTKLFAAGTSSCNKNGDGAPRFAAFQRAALW